MADVMDDPGAASRAARSGQALSEHQLDGAGRAALAPDRYRSFRLTYATVFVAATRERGTGSCPGSAGQHE